jgi:hypothetical protein
LRIDRRMLSMLLGGFLANGLLFGFLLRCHERQPVLQTSRQAI